MMPLPKIVLPGARQAEWERAIAGAGYCEAVLDGGAQQQAEDFRRWAATRRLALVDGPCPVAFDPKRYNPKDSLDHSRFIFLVRYLRPRPAAKLLTDIGAAFGIRSMYVLQAMQEYWTRERVIRESGGRVQADADILRLMGFSAAEVLDALDGIARREHLAGTSGNIRKLGGVEEHGQYVVNFALVKERYFEGEFILQVAGQPISLAELCEEMGVEDPPALRFILAEAKKRHGLDIQVSEDHVMFGAPSQAAIGHLSDRERGHKGRLGEMETMLRERRQTVSDLLGRYSAREAKIMNEIESLKDEGRMVYIKGKLVDAVQQRLEGKRPG